MRGSSDDGNGAKTGGLASKCRTAVMRGPVSSEVKSSSRSSRICMGLILCLVSASCQLCSRAAGRAAVPRAALTGAKSARYRRAGVAVVRCSDRRRIKGDPAMKKLGIVAALLALLVRRSRSPADAQVKGVYWATQRLLRPVPHPGPDPDACRRRRRATSRFRSACGSSTTRRAWSSSTPATTSRSRTASARATGRRATATSSSPARSARTSSTRS